MTNILVRKNGDKPVATPTAQLEWEPARFMRSMMGWDPFREMAPFAMADNYAFSPAFEVKEEKDAYSFKADVPGVKKEDIDVTLNGNRLTVSGKREAEKETKEEKYYAYERTYGSFTRSFTLPDGTDANAIHADLSDGVLTLLVPKRPEAMPKKIAIKQGAPKS